MRSTIKIDKYLNIYTFLLFNTILTIIFNCTKPRVFSEYVDLSNDGGVGLTKYFPILSLLAISVIYLSKVYTKRGIILNKSNSLLISLLYASTVVILINQFLSTKTEFNFSMLMFLLVVLTLSLDFTETEKVKKLFYVISIIYIIGSAFVGIFRPSIGLEYGYSVGYLPWRLHGIAALANHLAPVLVIFVVLSITDIFYQRISNRGAIFFIPMILMSIIEIILTQSKTTMISAVIWLAFVLILRYKGNNIVSIISKVFLIGFIAIYLRYTINIPENVDLSLTGRDKVWEFVFQEISSNRYFGYGARLWDTEMRENFFNLYFWYPGQSHNYWVQLFGQSGLVGLLAYVPYLIILIKGTFKLIFSNSFAISIFPFLLLMRSITESNMLPNNLHENYLLFILSIMFLVSKDPISEIKSEVKVEDPNEKI